MELERHHMGSQSEEARQKQMEAKQNWINRETKRIEAEVKKLTEMHENIKTQKEKLGVACEEIKKLRTELVHEGESMDKEKSHVLSPESLEGVRNREIQELCLRRVTASKRMAGASKDASTDEIASWSAQADRNRVGDLWKKKEKNPRGGREG